MYLTPLEYNDLKERVDANLGFTNDFLENNNFNTSPTGDNLEKSFQEDRIKVRSVVLKNMLDILNYSTILEEDGDNSVCKIGKKVTILLNGEEKTYTIGGDWTINGEISYKSPLGKSIIGKGEGDDFYYTVNGKEFEGEIISIS